MCLLKCDFKLFSTGCNTYHKTVDGNQNHISVFDRLNIWTYGGLGISLPWSIFTETLDVCSESYSHSNEIFGLKSEKIKATELNNPNILIHTLIWPPSYS